MVLRVSMQIAALCLCTNLLASAAWAQQKMTTVIRGTVSTTAAEWPNIVAKNKGFYKREGIVVEDVITSPTTITPTLIGGSIHVGFINASQMIFAIKAGANIVAVGQGMDPSPYTLVAGKTIKTVAGLKGKTLSLAEPGDAYTEVTKQILRKGGLDPDRDLNIRYGGNSNQRMAALTAGAVDAVPLVPPQDQMMLDQGYNALAFYPDFYPRLTLSLSAVNRSWANKNPQVLKGYLRALAGAIDWLNDPANKDEAIKLLVQGTKSNTSAATRAYDIYVTKIHMFPKGGCIQSEGLEKLIGLLSKINKTVSSTDPVSKFIDRQWCP